MKLSIKELLTLHDLLSRKINEPDFNYQEEDIQEFLKSLNDKLIWEITKLRSKVNRY